MQPIIYHWVEILTEGTVGEDDAEQAARGRDADVTRRIYRYFVETIKGGALRPGDRIPAERELAQSFGATRTTVRKALRVLEEDRLIERRLGSGTFVRHGLATVSRVGAEVPAVSPLDVLETRLAIEPGIVDLVVARATEEDFQRIGAAIGRMRSFELDEDDRAFKEAGYLVQLEIARATRNPLLVRLYEVILDGRVRAGWDTLRTLTQGLDRRGEYVRDAERQLAALRARDAEAARQITRHRNVAMIQEIVGRSVHQNSQAGESP